MGRFADELRAGIDEAVRKMAEAQRAGDDYGAEAYRERLSFLRRVAAAPASARGETGLSGAGRRGDVLRTVAPAPGPPAGASGRKEMRWGRRSWG